MITGRDSHTTMKFLRTITGRIVIVGTMIAIQVVWFLLFMYKLTDYSLGINIALKTLSLLVVLHIMGKNNNPASKLAWIIPVMAFPLLGGLLYLVLYQR